ncbi:MAG: hypothetical protein M0Z69_15265 [Actinomycetota bacterium]|nr:hypothetical protein [Actinomycetota bacterium]
MGSEERERGPAAEVAAMARAVDSEAVALELDIYKRAIELIGKLMSGCLNEPEGVLVSIDRVLAGVEEFARAMRETGAGAQAAG